MWHHQMSGEIGDGRLGREILLFGDKEIEIGSEFCCDFIQWQNNIVAQINILFMGSFLCRFIISSAQTVCLPHKYSQFINTERKKNQSPAIHPSDASDRIRRKIYSVVLWPLTLSPTKARSRFTTIRAIPFYSIQCCPASQFGESE